jgi:hypothetical protein
MREHYSAPLAHNVFSSLLYSHRPHWLPVILFNSETVRSGRKKTMREHYSAPLAHKMFFLFPIPDPDDEKLYSSCHCEGQSDEAISEIYRARREIASLRSQ